MLFLKNNWTENDLILTLTNAKGYRSFIKEVVTRSNHETINQCVEEEVANRFHNLVDSNESTNKILSIISHDLKSPFLGLLGVTEILLGNWKTLDDQQKIDLIKEIRKTSEETLKLLIDLLDWIKCQKHKFETSVNEIKVHKLVDLSIKVNENCAITKNVKIHNKINETLKVHADENMIATVFRNLISNAVKFSQPGGNVQISAKGNKSNLTFCVADNGSGIDKTHVIKMFKQVDSKQTGCLEKDYEGLGLLLCKEFIERSGGRIWLETQKDIGSKFYFTLPWQS